jgi:hypothetical protein
LPLAPFTIATSTAIGPSENSLPNSIRWNIFFLQSRQPEANPSEQLWTSFPMGFVCSSLNYLDWKVLLNRNRTASAGQRRRDASPLGQWTASEGDLWRYLVLSPRAMPR